MRVLQCFQSNGVHHGQPSLGELTQDIYPRVSEA